MVSLFLPLITKLSGSFATISTIVVVIFNLLFSINIFIQVSDLGYLSDVMGGWPYNYGIHLKVEKLDALFLILINLMACVSVLCGIFTQNSDVLNFKKKSHFYTLFLLCVAGFNGIIISNDLFNVYVFLEISSIVTYALLAKSINPKSKIAAFNYLVIGTVGATMYLIAVGILYMLYGTLNFIDIVKSMSEGNMFLYLSIIMMFVGLAIKSSVVPFHGWMIQSYYRAPLSVVVFFSAVATKIFLYLMLKFLYPIIVESGVYILQDLILIVSSLSMVYSAVMALRSKDMKKSVIYSSVVQVSYIVMSIGLGVDYSLLAAFLFIISHAITKSSLFISIGSLEKKIGSRHNIIDYISVFSVLISAASLIGLPLTAGFIPKLYLFYAVISVKGYLYLLPLLISTVCALIYCYNIVNTILSKFDSSRVNAGCSILILFLSVLNLSIGIYPSWISSVIFESFGYFSIL